jgi:hypothetical protein
MTVKAFDFGVGASELEICCVMIEGLAFGKCYGVMALGAGLGGEFLAKLVGVNVFVAGLAKALGPMIKLKFSCIDNWVCR